MAFRQKNVRWKDMQFQTPFTSNDFFQNFLVYKLPYTFLHYTFDGNSQPSYIHYIHWNSMLHICITAWIPVITFYCHDLSRRTSINISVFYLIAFYMSYISTSGGSRSPSKGRIYFGSRFFLGAIFMGDFQVTIMILSQVSPFLISVYML